jgi:hypothetical protein
LPVLLSLNVLTYGPGGAQGVVFTREDPGVFEDVQILGNVSGNGISRPLVNVGALPFFAIGGPIAGGVGIYMGTQAPGDLVPASPGPLYLQMGESGGATMFVNETGDAAGWRRV